MVAYETETGINPFLKKLTAGNAIERVKELRKQAQAEREAADIAGNLDLIYSYGSQWARRYSDAKNLQRGIKSIPTGLADASGKEIKVSLNRILPTLRTLRAQFGLPKSLPLDVRPASLAPNDYNASEAGNSLLPRLYAMGKVRQRYADANAARWVFGSAFVLLVRRVQTKCYPARDPETGETLTYENGEPIILPGNVIEPILIWPWQISRNTAVRSHRICDHNEIVITAALSLDEVKAITGGYEPKGEEVKKVKTMGQLIGTDADLALLCDMNVTPFATDSSLPGMMCDIAFFRDPDNSWLWPKMAVYAKDFDGDGNLYFGDSQIRYRPLFRFDLELAPGAFYGRGLPDLMRRGQNLYNVAAIGLAKHLLNFSATKPISEFGLLDQANQKKLLSNKTELVQWKRRDAQSTEPRYLETPNMPSSIPQVMNVANEHMDYSANTGGIARGEQKSHVPGDVVRMQSARLDAVSNEIGVNDTEELAEMSAAILLGSALRMPQEQIAEITGGALTADAISDLKIAGMSGQLLDVTISESDIQPMTRAEKEGLVITLATSGHLADPEVRRLLAQHTGFDIDPTEGLARAQARTENRKISAGKPVEPPDVFELHEVHVPVHLELLSTAGFRDRWPDRYQALVEHYRQTFESKGRRDMQIQIASQIALNETQGMDPLAGLRLNPNQGQKPGRPQLKLAGPPDEPNIAGDLMPSATEAPGMAGGESAPLAVAQ